LYELIERLHLYQRFPDKPIDDRLKHGPTAVGVARGHYGEDRADMGWLCPPPCQIYSAHENDAGVTAVLQRTP
jgi:hypothetical protein